MNDPSRVRITGPLASYASGFCDDLARLGYKRSSVGAHLHLVAHLSRWMHEQGVDAVGLTSERLEQFVEVRRSEERSVHLSSRAVDPVVSYLRRIGVAPEASEPQPCSGVERLLDRYRDYLTAERGLAEDTIGGYERVARRFLLHADEPGELDPQFLTAADVNRFLVAACVGRSPGAARNVATALRSLLGFLYLEKLVKVPLAEAVLSGPVRSTASLPQGVDAKAVKGLLGSCDRRRRMGRRDYAILMLLSRMGLRAGEIADLKLEDVDWRCGQILVRGKGGRLENLPLPADVGDALVGYLRRGRPRAESRNVFLRVPAPHRPLGASGITQVVYRACDRAGLSRVGAHRLRHTAATEMLRHGASLAEVAQALRHQGSAQTTAIYAKVDHRALSVLVVPWPGGAA